jgi:hypothetical protein
MKDVFLRRVGRSLVPTNAEGEAALESYPSGAVVRAKLTQERSLPHHKFFFAFLREVFENWPKTYKIQPPDEDWLRSWLLVMAGVKHSWSIAWDVLGPNPLIVIQILKPMLRQITSKPIFWSVNPKEGMVEADWAKSIAFHKMEEDEFKETTTRIFDVIYAEVGMDVEEHYKAWQKENGKLKIEPRRTVRGMSA